MSKGAELITQERLEQIHKHGWNETDDDYVNGELAQAALFCINPTVFSWPTGWSEHFKRKILDRDYQQRLVVAGAFIAAEIDRVEKVIEY